VKLAEIPNRLRA